MKQSLFLLLAFSLSCSGDPGGVALGHDGPFGDVPLTGVIHVNGLDGPVDIVRDKFGVVHIYAQSIGDAIFAEGYAASADRIVQMNLFRHFAEGTISELFGALDRGQIDQDLRIRMHRFPYYAQKTIDALTASTDQVDKDVLTFFQRYADGVNQYLGELRSGQQAVDTRIATFFDPARTADWTPLDSFTISRLELWSQDYDTFDIDATAVMQAAQDHFGGTPLANIFDDLFSVRPLDLTSTVDGFPGQGGHRHTNAPATQRPRVPNDVLQNALATMRSSDVLGLRNLYRGSNNWIVQSGGKALLANDPHLGLSNPPIWWMVHLTVPGKLDAEGVSLPGTPGIVLGHNGHVAWGATDVFHDVTDVYDETIAPCTSGGGDCVMFKGQEVKIETRQETLRIGALGTGNEMLTVTYETVPHHGPIIPIVQNHTIVPRTSNRALSVRYTGYEPTFEARAVYKLLTAANLDEAFADLEDWDFGGLNFVVIDDAGNMGWYPHAHIPWRTTPGCYTYNKNTNPMGVTPFAVLPADGSCEWEGYMESQYIPQSKNPATHFLATANADPVGATFDGDAFNSPMVNGHLMYLNSHYDPGYRVGRITRDLQALLATGQPVTLDDLGKIQGDTYSNYGADMRDYPVNALQKMAEEIANPGSHPDLHQFVSGLSADRRTQLMALEPILMGWSLQTPAATDPTTPTADIMDSAATTIFNVWAHKFLHRAFDDELAMLGNRSVDDYENPRAGLWVFSRPSELLTGVASQTGEARLCDDITTNNVTESCTFDALAALNDAVDWLTGHFGSSAPTDWRWGKLHTLTLVSQLPDEQLNIPPGPAMAPNGYPRHGDNYSVDASMPGFSGDRYTYDSGPSMRHLVTFAGPGQPVTKNALPGGEVFDSTSPHFRDQMDKFWSQNKYFDFAWSIADIHAVAEARTRLQPSGR